MSAKHDTSNTISSMASTGIPLRDSTDSYGSVSRFNHWLGTALVLTLLGIGLYFEDMPRGDEKIYWLKLHIAIGSLALVPLAFRVLWRSIGRNPGAFEQALLLQRVTQFIHIVLLLGITVLIISGPLAVWTGGRPIEVFSLFSIPSPMGKMETLHEALETVHVITTKIVLVAIILHVAGVIKHLLFERERLTSRMIGRKTS